LTDGLLHFQPFMTMSHTWKRNPKLTTFLNTGLDIVSRLQDDPKSDNQTAHSWSVTPGVIWRRGSVDYTIETTFHSTIGLSSYNDYSITVRPGVSWTLPAKFTLGNRNRWILGASVAASYGNRDSGLKFNLKLRTDFDFKKFIRSHLPQTTTQPKSVPK
jgi:hypothetical protein